jgi:ubiquinone/menaquinone biosynthesis C-methylase UbiE
VHKHFPNAELTCVDVSKRSLALAEERYPSYARYVHLEGTRIPFPSAHFDMAYAVCVFHHIDQAQHVAMLEELRRVIRPSGCLFVFEHNPLNPVTVRIVESCPLDENACLIPASVMKQRLSAAGFTDASIRYRLFFPHALRAFRPLERALRWLPLGGQYYVFARR